MHPDLGRLAMRQLLWCLSIFLAWMMNATAANAEILVGMAGALTGPNAYQGEQQQQGVEMAVADLNAAGGVLGQQLKVVSVDDACDYGQAVAAAYKLIEAKVSVVIGHQCSGASVS